MKHRRHLARSIAMTLGCALGATGLAHGQDAAPATLDLVNRTFTRLDANADGRIALSEARRVGVSARVFNGQDHDADQHLSKDEFTLLYRELLRPTGRKIGADLERAAKGIEEARKKEEDRQKQAELDAKRIQEAREKQAADSARARTEAARKKQADMDAQRTKEARQKQAAGGAGKPAGAGKPVRLPSKPKKAKRKAASDSSTPGAAPKKGARPAGSGGPDASKGAGGASSDGRG